MKIRLRDISVFSIVTSLSIFVHAADLVQGDTQGFSFPVLRNAFYEPQNIFYVGAAVPDAGKEFSIAAASSTTNKFMGLTPNIVMLNNQANQTNPLFGAEIAQLALLERRPVAVTKADDTTVYLINDVNSFSVLSAGGFRGPTGADNQHIVGITTDSNGFNDIGGNGIFLSLSPTSGTFGAIGSGIGLAAVQAVSVTVDKRKKIERTDYFLRLVNVNNPLAGFNQAAALDITSDALTIGAPLAAIHNSIVDMHWDSNLARLYLALQITTSTGAGNGGKAIATVRNDNGRLIIESIVTNSAVTNDSIIAAQRDGGVDISISKVRTMLTRTRLNYLIVAGGIGSVAATENLVFALPLVNTQPNNMTSGLLAKKDSAPVDIFSTAQPPRFINRTLATQATAPGDIPTSSDPAAMVGNGPAPGAVNTMSIVGDAVFVGLISATSDQQSGIFHSQALFSPNGMIKGWTSWRRVGGTNQNVVGVALDSGTGSFWYMPQAGSTVTSVLLTKWQRDNLPLSTLINSVSDALPGGIQGFADFPKETNGFNQTLGSRLSLAVATGYKTIMIIQTGGDNATNQFGPIIDFSNNFSSNNGTLTGFLPGVTSFTITGGALDELGPIVDAAIVTDGTQSWLVVGGSYGIAVLARDDGSGATGGFDSGFSTLDATMKFRKIDSYNNNVIRTIGAGTNLYVLTSTTLTRLAASSSHFALGSTATPTILATPATLPGNNSFFLDSLISEPFALLGTTGGLLRVGNGGNIATATTPALVNWTPVIIPESGGAVSKIFAISPTAKNQDVAFGGNVYVLNSLVSNHISRVYRYSLNVNPITPVIDDNSITLFNDAFLQGINTFFFNVGSYRNNVITDGALIFLTRSKYLQTDPFVQLLRRNLRFSEQSPMRSSTGPVVASGSFSLFNVVRNSGSGSWIVPGSFGVYINE